MQDFILNITRFIVDLFEYLISAFNSFGIRGLSLGGADIKARFIAFLDKPIFYQNSLIGINITYFELLYFCSIIFLTILFIVLVFKLVSGVIRFFFIGR